MLPFETALERVLALAQTSDEENIPLAEAVGRFLCADLASDRALPPFDYSAMDGYAVRCEDFSGAGPWQLPMSGESRAGKPNAGVAPNTTCRIFTGGALPAAANAVVMQENVSREGALVRFTESPVVGSNIRRRGEDLAQGQLAIRRGTRISPFHLGLLAALEVEHIRVWRKPKVVILCTGDELRRPGDAPRSGSIPESNGIAIAALVSRAGADATLGPLVPDDLAQAERHLDAALCEADVVLTIGGVSVGDHDVMRDAMSNQGVALDFWKVSIKPGKPLVVGRRGKQVVIGLPGNPVSAQVTCLLFVLPLLQAMQGAVEPGPRFSTGALTEPIRQKAGRRTFYRVTLSGNQITLARSQSSGSASSLAWADGLLMVHEESEGHQAGEVLPVLRFSDL